MFPTTYTISLFPPAFSYFWQFNPFIAMFNPTMSFSASSVEDFKLRSVSLTPKA